MPHVTAEYSKNLADSIDIGRLVQELHETMINSGLFEISTIRTRAAPRDIYVIADGRPENVFLQVIARIRPGRPPEDRKKLGNALLATCQQALASLPRVAIGVEVHELDPDMLFRHMTV
jgi:5-carboxymethyl-2-hydroxymuconate isomerase